MSDHCFQIKGSVLTVVVLELYHYSKNAFAKQLEQKTGQAAGFFQGSPVVISLENFASDEPELDFPELFGSCIEYGLQPVAVRGASELMEPVIRAMGLAVLARTSARSAAQAATRAEVEEPVQSAKADPEPAARASDAESQVPSYRPTKVISQPVRAGQQVYAQGADLIVLAQVGETAEVLADGHIHIYGALRGRALAGVSGDQGARIFCQSMEAQLIAVAGNFMLSDDIRKNVWKAPAQAYLNAENLRVHGMN